MLCELPTINVKIYTGTNDILYNFDVNLTTVNNDITPSGSVEPYSIPVFDLPATFKMVVTPMFDKYAISAHNATVECGIVDSLSTTNGIVDQDTSSFLWTTPTATFPISVYFDNTNIQSGNSGGGGGGGGGTPGVPTTTTGVPPLNFTSDGTPITEGYIEGNMVVTGTPSPSSVATVQEFGEFVTSGQYAGMYAIPVNVGGSTTNIYLSQPLRKIGDKVDKLEFSGTSGTVTRYLWKKVFVGTESLGATTSAISYVPESPYVQEVYSECVSTHYVFFDGSYSAAPNDSIYTRGGNGKAIFFKSSYGNDTSAAQTYFAQQYANGTPVTVWYSLATPITETVTIPTITPSVGSNTLTLGTAISPNDMSITCVNQGSGGASSAVDVSYDNSLSGLTATNVQDAITELASMQTVITTTEKTVTLLASNWNNSAYQLSDPAITSTSDIYINVPDGITKSQYDALAYANIISVGQTNGYVILSALRTVPTIDVPVRLVIKTAS